jgi:hypothetical protein
MCLPEHLEELRTICPGAEPMTDGPLHLVYLPKLVVMADSVEHELDGLLCLSQHQGYMTRLYLSQPFPNKRQNWTIAQLVGRQWHSWSWQGVPSTHRPAEILAQHLVALR